MKVVIIGGSGLIGRKLGAILQAKNHEIVAASPSTGVDSVSGTGVAEALTGADVVIDVSNSPSFEELAGRPRVFPPLNSKFAECGKSGRRGALRCTFGRRRRSPA